MYRGTYLLVDFVLAISFLAVFLVASNARANAAVNYEGYVYDDVNNLFPVVNGFAIAGTFAPGFNPYQYHCFYGDDEFCNMDSTHYSEAVADGNFLPIGAGEWTDSSGFFSGSGTTSAPAGTPIFLFVFDDPDPDAAGHWGLATSSHSTYLVPAGTGSSTTVHTSLANSFAFGFPASGGIALNGLPIPEPTTCALALVAVIGLGSIRRLRRTT